MKIFTMCLIGCSLAMDAFAVSITSGACISDMKTKQAVKIAGCFGFFQMIMPVLGWLLGLSFAKIFGAFDHWIAFVILVFLGIKMIYESKKQEKSCPNFTRFSVLLMLAIATSIDAFAVGITFALLRNSIIMPVVIIGIITFIICLSGVFVGKKFGNKLQSKAELIGGLILIFIGLQTLITHIVTKT